MLLALGTIIPCTVYAREGDCGYEGGISSGEAMGKTVFEYQEVCFITGEPVVFKGTLSIKKSLKDDSVVSTYTYNLKNIDKSATLTRVLSYNTKMTKKDNGQTIEETSLSKTPVETVKIDNVTYVLKSYDFTRSNLIDFKPAINYFAGNTWGRKIYQTGTASNGGAVTVEATGRFYGYDQYWGNTEVEIFNYIIESEKKNGDEVDSWGGTAYVSLSSSTTKQVKFYENYPDQISFDGGYVETQCNSSIMEYNSKLPEFDSKGVSTDRIIDTKDTLKIETFPVQKRLPVPDLRSLRGHWAENDIKALYSLEVFKPADSIFNPEQVMTRGEFTAAIVEAAKEVPSDPALTSRTSSRSRTTRNKTEDVIVSPFSDVSTESKYFNQIDSAYKRGLISGIGNSKFNPNSPLTVADALTIFIRATGLEVLAPNPYAVTTFRDNDQIPEYARNAIYVAEKIGLVRGDDRGYIRPNDKLTKARAAAFISRFINYMRDGIKKDYRERIINY